MDHLPVLYLWHRKKEKKSKSLGSTVGFRLRFAYFPAV